MISRCYGRSALPVTPCQRNSSPIAIDRCKRSWQKISTRAPGEPRCPLACCQRIRGLPGTLKNPAQAPWPLCLASATSLILSLTITWVRLLQRAIREQCDLCLALLAWIDRGRLLTDLARVAIDEALGGLGKEQEG